MLCYFCITFSHLSLAFLFIFDNWKPQKLYFWQRPFKPKSEVSADGMSLQVLPLSLNAGTGEVSVHKTKKKLRYLFEKVTRIFSYTFKSNALLNYLFKVI